MALDKAWPMAAQFERDRGAESPSPFGLLKGFFLATSPGGDIWEYEVDLDYHDAPGAAPKDFVPVMIEDALAGRPVHQRPDADQVLWGIQFLCPRCTSPLYVPTRHHPDPKTTPREVIVHWDKQVQAASDGRYRPLITVVGDPLKCDYLLSEVTGIVSPMATALRCGWAGILEEGKAYDHSTIRGTPVNTR